MLDYIDELLRSDNRALTWHPGMVACGSTGNRVYGAFSLKPGLEGLFHFVHKSDFRDLIKLRFEGIVYLQKLKTEYEWMPSYLYMKHYYPCFIIEERKYITENDIIASRITIISNSGCIRFKLGLESNSLNLDIENKMELFKQKISIKTYCSDEELFGLKGIMLEEGQKLDFTVACCFKAEKELWPDSIPDLDEHRTQYGSFYEGIPKLTCRDRDIERVYYYRWFLLRYHLANPKLGNVQHPIVFEGRHGYFPELDSDKEATPEWEFSRGILAPAAHHVLDMRWHEQKGVVKDMILNFTENLGGMDSFLGYEYDIPLLPGCIRIHDFIGHYFFHLLPYVVWQVYQSDKDLEWLKKVEPPLWKDLCGWSSYDLENSGLPLMIYEGDSAMEFGPASHYHKKVNGAEASAPSGDKTLEVGLSCSLESDTTSWGAPVSNRRTEVAAYFGLNYYAFAGIYESLGIKEKAGSCLDRYHKIRKAVMKYMWNCDEGFFMELTADFRQIPDIKQIGGIICLLLADPENPEKYLDNLQNPSKFKLNYGIASTSKDSFGYSPNNTVNGVRAHTCMWNGPTWPFSTSLALLAAGSYIKRHWGEMSAKGYIQYFKEEFSKYTMLHYLYGDRKNIRLVEHYNGETGMPLSWQDDYNHSCYIDIIIRIIGGLEFDMDGEISFIPIDIGVGEMKIERIPFNGSEYCIEIKSGKGYLYKNGNLVQIAGCV